MSKDEVSSVTALSCPLRCLVRNSSAIVEVEVSRPVCIELYQDSKEIGRFMLRHGGATIAAGVITKVSLIMKSLSIINVFFCL